MGLQNRDWYWEAYEEKYEKYGGDFSLQSKQKTKSVAYKKEDKKNGWDFSLQSKPKQKPKSVSYPIKKKIRKICKKCNTPLDLQIPKQFESTYTFICPKCNNKIHIYTWLGYFELIGASLITLLFIVIIVASII